MTKDPEGARFPKQRRRSKHTPKTTPLFVLVSFSFRSLYPKSDRSEGVAERRVFFLCVLSRGSGGVKCFGRLVTPLPGRTDFWKVNQIVPNHYNRTPFAQSEALLLHVFCWGAHRSRTTLSLTSSRAIGEVPRGGVGRQDVKVHIQGQMENQIGGEVGAPIYCFIQENGT